MDSNRINEITELLRQEIIPATGCTEPAAIALAVSYVSNISKSRAKSIKVFLSANMIKNAMGVGIPGTGLIGIPIAIALGWVIAKPEKGLEVLEEFSSEDLLKAKDIIKENIIDIKLKSGDNIDKLYIEVIAEDYYGHVIKSIISHNHTRLCHLSIDRNSVTSIKASLEENFINNESSKCEKELQLNFSEVYEYAMNAPLSDINFIYMAAIKNKEAAEYAVYHKMGHDIGRILKSDMAKDLIGDNVLTSMLSITSLACDARMDGAPITVVSNSGSGNQGITATLPVLSFAESKHSSIETTTRALALSSLIVIYVKKRLGRLSSLCGMIHSGLGISAAITYILGGNKQNAADAITNMVGSITGMICDGAKPSCTLKATTAISTAMISAILAMQKQVLSSTEGIIAEEVDQSIANLVRIGTEGMRNTDCTILNIMTNKNNQNN